MSDKIRFYIPLLFYIAIILGLPIGIFGQTGQPVDPTSYAISSGRLGANVAAALRRLGLGFGVLGLARLPVVWPTRSHGWR